jgi:hypothetical protein
MRLVMTLSMAMLDAITPEPVYGMPSSSSAPCTVPSSPMAAMQRDEAARKPSRFSSTSSRSDGSKACASTPLERSAFEHAGARHQRHLALGRGAAHEHGHLAEVLDH